eukprot:741261-Amphidinium_carterae.2
MSRKAALAEIKGLEFQFALAYATGARAELLLGVHFKNTQTCSWLLDMSQVSIATVAPVEPAHRLVESMARVIPLAPLERPGADARQ